jgi:hypothetical protein
MFHGSDVFIIQMLPVLEAFEIERRSVWIVGGN